MKKMTSLSVGVVLLVARLNCFAGALLDPALTPGAINPDVRQANVGDPVCVKGWAKAARPPMSYTNRLKNVQIRQHGYADTHACDYEEDHLIPLGVGGNPTDPHNLWPQPRKSQWNAGRKDELEFALYKGVCNAGVPLADAQRAFTTDWIDAYRRYGALRERYRYDTRDWYVDSRSPESLDAKQSA